MTAPGPIESNRGATGLKIVLHADADGVYSGFKARYVFETAKSIFGDCGGNVSSLDYGVISSPNFPENYDGPTKGPSSKTCNWYINVRPKYKILLDFESFAVEGDPVGEYWSKSNVKRCVLLMFYRLLGRGCPAAVLRLWTNMANSPIELCGEKAPSDKWQYLSDSNAIRFR